MTSICPRVDHSDLLDDMTISDVIDYVGERIRGIRSSNSFCLASV